MYTYNCNDFLNNLKKTNREYAATKMLGKGIEKGFVRQGKISLNGLGEYLATPEADIHGYGTGTSQHPLYPLGYAGRAVKLRSRFEGTEHHPEPIANIIGRTKHLLGTAAFGRTDAARALQKAISK